MSNDRIIKSGDIEKMLKEEIRQAIIVLYNYDVVTGQYVDKELQKEKMIKEITGKWEGKYSEETIREAMNKANQHYKQTYEYNHEQSIIDYNKMEEEWEMENYNEMKDEQQ